ncbi:phage tail protein [Corallococcus sp. CA047B]|uniref:phage tail protein n=1 Tax=Corallococcus sp. CA047B TaxID=2316729 RepID=UPI000EA2EB88|nr:phage tail protein [Corallococcus sp. CA047B]RKH19131.1 phage tail protein [Corallococcus sp. CA047B]
MSNAAPVFRKPLGMPRKFHKRITIDGAEYDLCHPTTGDKADVVALSQKAGDINEQREPMGIDGGLRFLGRAACACLYYPGGARRVFDVREDADAVKNEPWLDEHQADVLAAFGGPTVQEARGNSEATPS